MPAIDTVRALTANDAWIWVSTTTMSGSQELFVDVDGAVLILRSSPVVHDG